MIVLGLVVWVIAYRTTFRKLSPLIRQTLNGAPQTVLILLAGLLLTLASFMGDDRWIAVSAVYLALQAAAGAVAGVVMRILFIDGSPWKHLPSWAPAPAPFAMAGPTAAAVATSENRPSRLRHAVNWVNGSLLRKLYVRLLGTALVEAALEWRIGIRFAWPLGLAAILAVGGVVYLVRQRRRT